MKPISQRRTYLQLTPEEETLVRQIAATHTLAAMDARVILYTAYGEEIIFALPELPPIIADNIGNWYIHFKNQANVSMPLVTVYPNPTIGSMQVQIQTTNLEPKQLQIYNIMGALVYEDELLNHQTQLLISIQNWASGLYYYQLTDNNGATYTGKFVVSGK
ncbi:MAG TPA: T9SS type A sorting domain-containing protein [Chitinophagales bacterium]|nr:T9SS type A sorting domain-containing protein [Chitinophagales bacterium]